MVVIALGACGEMGRVAAAACVASTATKRVIVADLNSKGAARLAQELGPKAVARAIDINDQAGLVSLLAEADLVLATIGPYYKFGSVVLKAAIEAGCNYIDICDDWEPTLELLALHEEAEAAGITAIVGMGASPGVSSLLAVKAIRELDSVQRVYTTFGSTSRNERVADDGDSSSAAAAIDHLVHQATGTICNHERGARTVVAPLQQLKLNYPQYGEVVTYTVGHPEPVTLPIYFPEIQYSATLMVLPDFLIVVLKDIQDRVDMGVLTVQEASRRLFAVFSDGKEEQIQGRDLLRYFWYTAVEILRGKTYVPEITAHAIGKKDGANSRVVTFLNGVIDGGMGPNTCLPTVVAMELIAQGVITQHGVFAPEGVVEPDPFFERLSEHYSRVSSDEYGPVRVISA